MATLPTTPTAATVGSKITASNWNNQVQLPEEFFRLNRPICVAYQTVAQSVPAATNTPITFDSESLDRDNQHSTTTNTDRIVIGNTLGWYKVTASAAYSANGTGERRIFITKNGSVVPLNGSGYATTQPLASVTTTAGTTAYVQATVNTDYVQVCAYSSVALNTAVGNLACNVIVEWIGS